MIVDLYKNGRSGLFVPTNTDVNKIISKNKALNKFKGIEPQSINLDEAPLIGGKNEDIKDGINKDGYYVAEAQIVTKELKV